ncbi:MAG: hypothetical protein HYY29_04680 [Chloroflexi bacterium]|nr:hypothetical protein [Chloroflexota bacterium]
MKLREGASKGKIGEAIGAAKEIFHRLVLHKYDPQCPFPCNCMEELEDIFHEEEGILRRGSVSGKALYLFQEKLPLQDEEIDRAWGFLKRELNPRFERRSLEFLQSRKIEKKFDQEPIPKLRLNP